jgi:hypothetical protein
VTTGVCCCSLDGEYGYSCGAGPLDPPEPNSMDVDLTDGFEIGAISVKPFDCCEYEAAEDFLVEGY